MRILMYLVMTLVCLSACEKKIKPIEPEPIVKIEEIKPNPTPKDTTKVVVVKDSVVKKTGGEQIFEFYDVTPAEKNFSFPSHSVVIIPPVGENPIGDANSFCEYWLYTNDGKLVCYCKNTVSGLHPVYSNTFNGGNHSPEFTKKIGYGVYRLVYKNISKVPVRQDLRMGTIISEFRDQVDTKVDSGETKEFLINIYRTESDFKMNNNNKDKI